jgi:hypothetical protein
MRFLVPLLQAGRPPIQNAAPLRDAAFFRLRGRARATGKPNGQKKRRLTNWPAPFSEIRDQVLLDLGFLELDMLLGNRVILGLGHLVRERTAVLRGDVEETGVSRRQQLDLDGRSFRHGCSASKK